MAYYKLIDAISVPQKLNVVARMNGANRYVRMTLQPGVKYEIPEDEVLLNSILGCKTRIKYSKESEALLKSCNARYEVKRCPSCGGRVLKLEYYLVEVCDEAKSD